MSTLPSQRCHIESANCFLGAALEEGARGSRAARKDTDMPASQKNVENGREGARQAADAMWRTTESMQRTAQSTLNTTKQEMQRAAEQFTEVLGLSDARAQELTRQSSQTIDAVTQCGAVLARGAQDISREWVKLAGDRLQRNLEGLKELAHCRTVPDLISVQTRLARENMEHMLSNGRRIAEMSLQVASEASQIAGRVEDSGSRSRRAA
jgi:phasin family protein